MIKKEIDEKLFQNLVRDHAEVIVHVGLENAQSMIDFLKESGCDDYPPRPEHMTLRYGDDLCLYIAGIKTPRWKTTMYGPIDHAQKCAKEEGFILIEYEDLLISRNTNFDDIDILIRV